MTNDDIVILVAVGIFVVLAALWTWFCWDEGDHPAGWP